MAIRVLTDNPSRLLAAIKKAIDVGDVETWTYDDDGDLTHSPKQWENLAWLRPSTGADRLVFNIIKQQDVAMSMEVYGVYHGRFMEMLLVHFDALFTIAYATAMPTTSDYV